MSIFNIFGNKKKDSEVEAAERRAYEKEQEIVHREKKQAAVKAAGERGRLRARGKIGSPAEEKAAKVGRGIIKAGGALMKLGEYGAGLNWGNEPVQRQQPAAHKGKKGKKQKKQVQQDPMDQFAMPEFPF